MNSLRNLLRDADPLRYEGLASDSEREQLRARIVRLASEDGSTIYPSRVRMSFRAAVLAAAVAMAIGYGMWLRGTTPLMAAVGFEMRLAEETPVPGLIVANVPGQANRLLYLHPEIVVNNDDIAQTWVTEDVPGQFGVSVQFLPSGADRVRQATATHVGRPVAILINGNIAMAPILKSAIADSALITSRLTRAEAERIADGIKPR